MIRIHIIGDEEGTRGYPHRRVDDRLHERGRKEAAPAEMREVTHFRGCGRLVDRYVWIYAIVGCQSANDNTETMR